MVEMVEMVVERMKHYFDLLSPPPSIIPTYYYNTTTIISMIEVTMVEKIIGKLEKTHYNLPIPHRFFIVVSPSFLQIFSNLEKMKKIFLSSYLNKLLDILQYFQVMLGIDVKPTPRQKPGENGENRENLGFFFMIVFSGVGSFLQTFSVAMVLFLEEVSFRIA
jgi:hypothetical protein